MAGKTQAKIIAGAAGMAVHLLLIFYLVTSDDLPDSLYCHEASCFSLIAADFPVSLLFAGGDHNTITWGAAILGTIWWAVLGAGVQHALSALSHRRAA